MNIQYDVGDFFKCNKGYGVCITKSLFILINEEKGVKVADKLAQIPEDSVPVHEEEQLRCKKSTIFTLKCIAMTALAWTGTLNNFNSIKER